MIDNNEGATPPTNYFLKKKISILNYYHVWQGQTTLGKGSNARVEFLKNKLVEFIFNFYVKYLR